MTRTTRALRAAARNEEQARQFHTQAARAGGGPASAELHQEARRYERTAAEWLRIAADEAAKDGIELRDCCGASAYDDCDPSCGCDDCAAQRACAND